MSSFGLIENEPSLVTDLAVDMDNVEFRFIIRINQEADDFIIGPFMGEFDSIVRRLIIRRLNLTISVYSL